MSAAAQWSTEGAVADATRRGASVLQHLPQLPICNFDALIADEVLFADACCDNTAQGLQKLGVDALAFDYPLGPSKGYATRVVLLSRKGLSHEPCSCPVFKMQVPAFIPGWLGLQISSSRHLFFTLWHETFKFFG